MNCPSIYKQMYKMDKIFVIKMRGVAYRVCVVKGICLEP
jgi:hypothetical protein